MVEIIEARPDDWRLVREVRLRALADSPDSFCATLPQAERLSEAQWRTRLSAGHPTFLALDGDEAVAMGGGFSSPASRPAEVWGMWTAPSHRGLGLGRQVLDSVVGWARAAGRTPYLQVTEGNDAARALYVSFGFEPTGVWGPLREGSDLRIEEMVLRPGSRRR